MKTTIKLLTAAIITITSSSCQTKQTEPLNITPTIDEIYSRPLIVC